MPQGISPAPLDRAGSWLQPGVRSAVQSVDITGPKLWPGPRGRRAELGQGLPPTAQGISTPESCKAPQEEPPGDLLHKGIGML